MANQTDPNQNLKDNFPPIIPPQSDLPPLPANFFFSGGLATGGQKAVDNTSPQPATQPAVQPSVNDTTPVANTPPVVSVTPKKKYGSGRIIATILGILILVGGVGAGIVLTQQKQLIPQQAAGQNIICTTGGSITTQSGKKYCLINSSTSYSLATSSCNKYGSFASLLDGETKQDILDLEVRIKTEGARLSAKNPGCAGYINCQMYIKDSCTEIKAVYGEETSLYSGGISKDGLKCPLPQMGFNITPPESSGYLGSAGTSAGGVVCEMK
jgi:hypothetical protein